MQLWIDYWDYLWTHTMTYILVNGKWSEQPVCLLIRGRKLLLRLHFQIHRNQKKTKQKWTNEQTVNERWKERERNRNNIKCSNVISLWRANVYSFVGRYSRNKVNEASRWSTKKTIHPKKWSYKNKNGKKIELRCVIIIWYTKIFIQQNKLLVEFIKMETDESNPQHRRLHSCN